MDADGKLKLDNLSPLELFFLDKNTPEEIRGLIVAMETMVKRSKEKTEDMSDKLDLLRKVEIKFYQLVEWRQLYTERDPASEKRVNEKELDLNRDRKTKRLQAKNELDRKTDEEKRQLQMKKRADKEFLLQTLGRREPKRSHKVVKEKKKEDKKKFTESQELMLKYLGDIFEDTTSAPAKTPQVQSGQYQSIN